MDFPNIELQDRDEYDAYVEHYWQCYSNNTFAIYRSYRLDLGGIRILSWESMENQLFEHLKLNDKLIFRLVNTVEGRPMKCKSYEELKELLTKRGCE